MQHILNSNNYVSPTFIFYEPNSLVQAVLFHDLLDIGHGAVLLEIFLQLFIGYLWSQTLGLGCLAARTSDEDLPALRELRQLVLHGAPHDDRLAVHLVGPRLHALVRLLHRAVGDEGVARLLASLLVDGNVAVHHLAELGEMLF